MFRRESCALWPEFCISASVTSHHDLLREDELVDFPALLPRLDDVEPEDDFFAVERGRLCDESLDVAFFAVPRDRLDDGALEAVFFAGLLDAEPDEDRLEDLRSASDLPLLSDEPRDDLRAEP